MCVAGSHSARPVQLRESRHPTQFPVNVVSQNGFPATPVQFASLRQVTQTPGAARQVPPVPHCVLLVQATQISGPVPMLPVIQVGVAAGHTGGPLSSLHPLRQWWFGEHWGPCSEEVVEQSFAALT